MSLKSYLTEGKISFKGKKEKILGVEDQNRLELTELSGADHVLLKDMLEENHLILTYQGKDLYDVLVLEMVPAAWKEIIGLNKLNEYLDRGGKIVRQKCRFDEIVYQPSSQALFMECHASVYITFPKTVRTNMKGPHPFWKDLKIENHKGRLTVASSMPPQVDSVNLTEICDLKEPIDRKS